MIRIVLRIFSGSHNGAEIELPEGTYALGTDDSCDVILSDSTLAARHAALEVKAGDDGAPQLLLSPLDGEAPVPAPAEGEPFRLGMVRMAWSAPGHEAETWAETERVLAAAAQSADGGTPEAAADGASKQHSDDASESQAEDAGGPADGTADSAGAADGPREGDGSDGPVTMREEEKPRRKGLLGAAGIAAAAALTAVLCTAWNAEPQAAPVEAVRSLLSGAGFTTLSAEGRGDSVLISGSVAGDAERGRLLELTRTLGFPVFLHISVGSDIAEAVRSAFTTQGIFLDVSELPSHDGTRILARGYIKTGVLEEQAFSSARASVPALMPSGSGPAPMIVADIRHLDEVKPVVDEAFAAAGIVPGEVVYLPGRVFVHGAFDPAGRSRLDTAIADINERLGISVPFLVANDLEGEPHPERAQNVEAVRPVPQPAAPRAPSVPEKTAELPASSETAAAPAVPAEPPRPKAEPAAPHRLPMGITISSVSCGGMKFVTLPGGERIFPGGEVYGGYVLEDVTVDAITLSRNGTRTEYPLKGAQ